jgi:hypothetical protein
VRGLRRDVTLPIAFVIEEGEEFGEQTVKHDLRRVGTLLWMIILLQALSVPGEAEEASHRKKLIATGLDHADSGRLLQNLGLMEKRPFDGVAIEIEGRIDEAKRCPLRLAFTDEAWKTEWFQPSIEELKACRFKGFTDNFVTVNANPGDVDWFDDSGWDAIVHHWRIAAWIAKESGFKGILFDPEPYTKPYAQFNYAAQPNCNRYTFEEYYAKARQRGREVMREVVGVYPEITLLSYFMNSVNAAGASSPDPRRTLPLLRYNLYPAFIDGWLDAVPPSVTLVDGCETAYLYNSPREFLQSAVLIKGACQGLVSPENRAKYRAQVQAGFGVYLDAYWNPKEPQWMPWHIDGRGGPRVDRLRANVSAALQAADEYVWIYGEKFRWWPTPNENVRDQTWPEALPGCDRALFFARDPLQFARWQLSDPQRDPPVNLAQNGDFGSAMAPGSGDSADVWKEGSPPAGWRIRQKNPHTGTFMWDQRAGARDKGSALIGNVDNGCLAQGVLVRPGDFYAIRAARKLQGTGEAWLRIRWKTDDGTWFADDKDTLILCQGPKDEWAEMFGVIEVPESAGKLMVLLCVHDQPSLADIAWFDDVELYRLEP